MVFVGSCGGFEKMVLELTQWKPLNQNRFERWEIGCSAWNGVLIGLRIGKLYFVFSIQFGGGFFQTFQKIKVEFSLWATFLKVVFFRPIGFEGLLRWLCQNGWGGKPKHSAIWNVRGLFLSGQISWLSFGTKGFCLFAQTGKACGAVF